MTNPHLNRILARWQETNRLLTEEEKVIVEHLHLRRPISHNPNPVFDEQMTFGQRLADQVASFGGSWTFIILFGIVLLSWVLLNTLLLIGGRAFDPFPFIFLNLILSMLAAIQAPVIMMSQNRQAAKDRLDARHDYEVNLKAELEILTLHEKIDHLQLEQWRELIDIQQRQIDLLERLLGDERSKTGAS